ncbi:LLM class flavin-dependent oxidoreductase [Streptomyces sp. NBC_00878]|uniref:LLM class flavin-dependent oxidoreductase n=1 Tax=Streptomyces sp. NBC_00878 TaxID=2975854 RepID=UPI002258293C|nr:LLM class flavin-dependent oxidoreductase [Streptomyces sp. NBC_00878]MCX4906890.1 LLM class flavin-dependent oxidoreductase [Streptomyces sp. NBC_00878]
MTPTPQEAGAMRLAVNLTLQGAADLARTAEELGYAAVLAPEGFRSDAASLLGLVAGQTRRLALVSGVMQMPARPPGLAALTAATLDALSGGRFRLGLGISNPDVSRGWYGADADRPLGRTREYVEIVRRVLSGEPVVYRGRHYSVGDPAPVRLLTGPAPVDLPVYLGAVGPRNLRLAGEIADGWIGVFTSPEAVADAVGAITEGRKRAGKDLDGFDVLPCLPTAVGPDPATAADRLRGQYVYLMGMGDAERNVYCALARRLGHGRAAEELRARLAAGDRAGAGAALPVDLIDRTALIGPVPRIAERMAEYAGAGVTTLGIMVSAAAVAPEERLAILRGCAQALEKSGVAG